LFFKGVDRTVLSGTPPTTTAIPTAAGIGLRSAHYDFFSRRPGAVPWLEVHSENFFAPDSIASRRLEQLRETYPLSLHGVGLSLGSADALNVEHLRKLRELVDRVRPGLVSEHLSWSSVDGRFLNDLLPLPYTEETIDVISHRIAATQDFLERRILVENVSSYLTYRSSSMTECEFLTAVAERSGCGILLDINNIYVSATNHGFDPREYILGMPAHSVGEFHLAGHSEQLYEGHAVLVDTHDAPICEEVWTLFELALEHVGPRPVLIEWDARLPEAETLLDEARKAQHKLDAHRELAA
jgi:hypothetical protein